MTNISPESPEERRKHPEAHPEPPAGHGFWSSRTWTVIKRVSIGVYSEGFIHAGNLAYLSLVTLFPFFIVAAAIARLFGQTEGGMKTVIALLQTMPPDVAAVIAKPISDVLAARSGNLLWFGAIVGLWTTASFIETIRDIIRRAYGVTFTRPFWEYRLGSMGIIVLSVIIALTAFAISVFMSGIEQVSRIEAVLLMVPGARALNSLSPYIHLIPAGMLYVSLYLIFLSLTPKRYRRIQCHKWPGALLVTVWWLATTALLPVALSTLGSYDLTYGSLAGVMISLIFFFAIGLGLVIGAHLNAALAETPAERHAHREEARVKEAAE